MRTVFFLISRRSTTWMYNPGVLKMGPQAGVNLLVVQRSLALALRPGDEPHVVIHCVVWT
jgi:hypothetical protein